MNISVDQFVSNESGTGRANLDLLSNLSRVSHTFLAVEKKVVFLENKIGKSVLVDFVNNISTDTVINHVNIYRDIIRNNEWPNHAKETGFREFIDDFEVSCLAYIDVCSDILSEEGSSDLVTHAFASEALRAQYGKRSLTGLDNRLEILTEDLIHILALTDIEDIDELLFLLCSPTLRGHESAEDILCNDYLSLIKYFDEPPTKNDVLKEDGKRGGVLWNFFRRHAKWNVALIDQVYHALDADTIKNEQALTAQRVKKFRFKLNKYLEYLFDVLSPTLFKKLKVKADQIASLNYLNLTLEPLYSFKGGVGLVHIHYLTKANSSPISLDHLNNLKWKLFSLSRGSND